MNKQLLERLIARLPEDFIKGLPEVRENHYQEIGETIVDVEKALRTNGPYIDKLLELYFDLKDSEEKELVGEELKYLGEQAKILRELKNAQLNQSEEIKPRSFRESYQQLKEEFGEAVGGWDFQEAKELNEELYRMTVKAYLIGNNRIENLALKELEDLRGDYENILTLGGEEIFLDEEDEFQIQLNKQEERP